MTGVSMPPGVSQRHALAADREHIVAQTADLWPALMGERVFVTGGTGFVGTWILEAFVAAQSAQGIGAEAVVLTRDPDAFTARAPHLARHPSVKLVVGDVRTFDFPSPCSHIIHAATDGARRETSDGGRTMVDTVVNGSRRVLEFARAGGTRRLLYVSSGAVYGRQPPSLPRIPEDYSGAPALDDPASAYGEAKRIAEMMCLLEGRATGLHVTIARGFSFVGPNLPLDSYFAIGNFLRDALGGGPIRVTGDGTPRRSYLYSADLAIWLWTLLLRGGAAATYNVGSMTEVSIAELAELVAELAGPAGLVTIEHTPPRGTAPTRYVPDTRRAEHELGLRACIDLRDSLVRTLAWHRNVEFRGTHWL
jgi:dTDP-glucose 4,6-dehydratase